MRINAGSKLTAEDVREAVAFARGQRKQDIYGWRASMPQLQLDTPYGPIYVTPQGDRKLYVQAGRGAAIEGRSYNDGDPPNLVVRGISIYVNGHLERDTSTSLWRVQSGFMSVRRAPAEGAVTGLGDAPPGATKQVVEAILAAAEEVPEDVLAESQRTTRENEAKDRVDDANKLADLVNRLMAEAAALRTGGRVEYHEHHLQSGLNYTARHVRTAEGELLPSLPTVKVYGTDDYGPRLPHASD